MIYQTGVDILILPCVVTEKKLRRRKNNHISLVPGSSSQVGFGWVSRREGLPTVHTSSCFCCRLWITVSLVLTAPFSKGESHCMCKHGSRVELPGGLRSKVALNMERRSSSLRWGFIRFNLASVDIRKWLNTFCQLMSTDRPNVVPHSQYPNAWLQWSGGLIQVYLSDLVISYWQIALMPSCNYFT